MDGLVEVIRAICNQIDLSRQIVPLLTEISESSFYGSLFTLILFVLN